MAITGVRYYASWKCYDPWSTSVSMEGGFILLEEGRCDDDEYAVTLLPTLHTRLLRNSVSILLPRAAVPTPAMLDMLPKPNSVRSLDRDSRCGRASRGIVTDWGLFLNSLVVRWWSGRVIASKCGSGERDAGSCSGSYIESRKAIE